jgi:hypothetical protein
MDRHITSNSQFKTIDKYTIDLAQKLGQGKYGAVYQAFSMSHSGEPRENACKILNTDDDQSDNNYHLF